MNSRMSRTVIAFDWDGTLTNESITPVGTDDPDRVIELAPLKMALDAGHIAVVMTCNEPGYVADILRDHGIHAVTDPWLQVAAWDGGADGKTVLVTNRKVLADLYVDDRAFRYRFGDDPASIFAGLNPVIRPEGDGCVPALPGYERASSRPAHIPVLP